MNTVSKHQQASGGDWRSPLGLALIAYYLVMAVVGLSIPDDILSANAWAREFSDFMASIVPQINRITALGIKPDVNRFYFSVLWAGSPIAFCIWGALIVGGRHRNYPIWSMPFAKSLTLMAALMLCFAWTQCLWAVDPNMRLSKVMFSAAIGRGAYAQLVFCTGAVFCLAGIVVWAFGWLTGYIPRRIKEQKNG